MDDGELLIGLRADRPTALRLLYDRYGELIHRIAEVVVGSSEVADGLTGETFVAFWRDRGVADQPSSRLIGILRQLLIERMGDHAREHIDGVVDRLVVADELESSPSEQKRILELALLDGLPSERIVSRTGWPADVVVDQLDQGLRRLRLRWEVDGAVLR